MLKLSMRHSQRTSACRQPPGRPSCVPRPWPCGNPHAVHLVSLRNPACALSRPCNQSPPGLRGARSRRERTHSRAAGVQSVALSSERGKVLVLGGTGFAGSEITKALLQRGLDVVAVSRRASSAALKDVHAARLTLVSADLVKHPDQVGEILTERGPFVGVVHCIGMLLPNRLNALASGSGSVPGQGTTYDVITRATACSAADAAASHRGGCAFVFISAAEAGWPEDTPLLPPFLKDYLTAKRAVETHLQDLAESGGIRPVIMRPSLIWTPARPAALPPVAAFTLASMLGIPGVQKPVRVDTLASAVGKALADQSCQGIWKSEDMQRAADK